MPQKTVNLLTAPDNRFNNEPPPRGSRRDQRSRAIVDPSGNYYPTVTAAAVATGTPLSTLSGRLLAAKRSGWRYADEALDPAASPTPVIA